MASMAVCLRSRPRSFLRASAPAYSSSSRSQFPDARDQNPQNIENTQSNSRSSFNDVKSHLHRRDWQPPQQPPRQTFSFTKDSRFPPPNNPSSSPLDEIRKNLSEYRLRSPQGQPPASFQDLYKKMTEKPDESRGSGEKANLLALASIKDQLNRMKPSGTDGLKPHPRTPLRNSILNVGKTLNMRPESEGTSDGFPLSVFGKELKEKSKMAEEEDNAGNNELVKDYSKSELGEKLKKLRPEGVNQFSLSELNERLIKLRGMEKNEVKKSTLFGGLKDSLQQIRKKDMEVQYKDSSQKLGILGRIDGTPTYMLTPPKEHLVEKYFHPDNMSSAEKLKIELKRVRDEFKMSETDCGSTRVQIAQLTTEISHLSKVLHKKDKHSKKGLLGKVQLRKKLLKYLRRTDWDSYCFILSKLGLRDNPGYKQH